MSRKPITGLAPGVTGRWTTKGTISLQVRDPHTLDASNQPKRVTPRAIDPSEPASYETIAQARAASYRLAEKVREKVQRGVSVREFWEQWTTPDHWRWRNGRTRQRTEQTMASYRSRTATFVETFGERSMASITEADVNAYMASEKGSASQVSALSVFFTDSMRKAAGPLRSDNPFAEVARDQARVDRTKRKEQWTDAPEPHEIARLLAHAHETTPFSFYAWLLIATETGMRCAEIDAMKIEHLNLSAPSYWVEEQFNHKLRKFTAPKYNSRRTIVLPPALEPVLRRLIFEAARLGSPYLLNSPNGRRQHWSRDTRETYWSGKGGRDALREQLDSDVTLYEATRHYFTTRAVIDGAPIHFLAKHLGHSDRGETLMTYYARLNDRQAQDAMAAFFADRSPANVTPIRSARHA